VIPESLTYDDNDGGDPKKWSSSGGSAETRSANAGEQTMIGKRKGSSFARSFPLLLRQKSSTPLVDQPKNRSILSGSIRGDENVTFLANAGNINNNINNNNNNNNNSSSSNNDNNNNNNRKKSKQSEGVTSLMVACQQGLEHDVTNIIYKKVKHLMMSIYVHAEGQRYKKTVTGFRYPRACRFRKYQFENRSWVMGAPSTNFFQNVIFTS
jgi:hypothetical protein